MLGTQLATLFVAVGLMQVSAPPYVLEGDRVEQRFFAYTGRLAEYFQSLRVFLAEEAPSMLSDLDSEDLPDEPGVYGYQLLPRIVNEVNSALRESISSFSYSWPITEGYISNENQRLTDSQAQLQRIKVSDGPIPTTAFAALIQDYRELVDKSRENSGRGAQR